MLYVLDHDATSAFPTEVVLTILRGSGSAGCRTNVQVVDLADGRRRVLAIPDDLDSTLPAPPRLVLDDAPLKVFLREMSQDAARDAAHRALLGLLYDPSARAPFVATRRGGRAPGVRAWTCWWARRSRQRRARGCDRQSALRTVRRARKRRALA